MSETQKPRRTTSTLANLLTADFHFYGLTKHPLIQRILALIHQDKQEQQRRFKTAIAIAFAAGIIVDHSWFGTQVTSLHDTLASWRTSYERDYKNHHDLTPVTAAKARAIAGQLDRQRDITQTLKDCERRSRSLTIKPAASIQSVHRDTPTDLPS